MRGSIYSKVQLEEMVKGMNAVNSAFYPSATKIGHHAFIEFCGLMGEYIKMCEAALAAGEDFTTTNIHVGGALPIRGYNALYLAEKFECIFGTTFSANPDMAKLFIENAFPGFTLAKKK